MLQRIRNKEFNAVMIWRLDRLGRSLKHLLQLIEEFRNKNVAFISLTEGFDTTTAQGELFLHISGAYAQFERALIQERINAGLKRAKEQGKSLGRPKGSKDIKARRKSGYWLRWVGIKNNKTKLKGGNEKMEIGEYTKQSGAFLKAQDVNDNPEAVFMITSEGEMVKSDKFDVIRLHLEGEFNKEPKIFDCSKTNARFIQETLGEDTKKWVGKGLMLETYKTKTSDGKLVEAINVKGVKI